VNDHLRALEKKGFLHREDLKSRALRPLVTDDDMVDVPVLGKVAAGQPMLAVQNYEDTVKVDRFFIGQSREVFALRVKGDSMIEAGIFDGDYVFIRKQLQATPGDIVVAMIGDEATVKRYYPEGDTIRFQPANSAMAPIIVRRRDFRSVNLLGVVIGVYRKMA
jgi:repressor LexA